MIDTSIIHGRQGIPLRGTDDAGNLTLDESDENDEHFRTLLRMRMRCGDAVLQSHMTNFSRNAMYLSPEVQNELILIPGEEVLQQV